MSKEKVCRAANKIQGPGISPGYSASGLQLLLLENRRKIEPKKTPRCFIPCLVFAFTQQLEILVTALCMAWVATSVVVNFLKKLLQL